MGIPRTCRRERWRKQGNGSYPADIAWQGLRHPRVHEDAHPSLMAKDCRTLHSNLNDLIFYGLGTSQKGTPLPPLGLLSIIHLESLAVQSESSTTRFFGRSRFGITQFPLIVIMMSDVDDISTSSFDYCDVR